MSSLSQNVHDVRNALGTILMQSQMLSIQASNGSIESEMILESTQEIEEGVQKIVALLQEIEA